MLQNIPQMLEITRAVVDAVKIPVTVKTRYRAPDGSCVIAAADTAEGTMSLTFPDPQWSATPGQSAVLYAGDVCLGGGFIDTVAPFEA